MKTKTLTENKLAPSKGEWEAINNHARYAGNYPKTLVVANGKQVANCYIPKEENNIDSQQAEANATFICKAVNNHDSMLNALKIAHEYVLHCKVNKAIGEIDTDISIIEDAIKTAEK